MVLTTIMIIMYSIFLGIRSYDPLLNGVAQPPKGDIRYSFYGVFEVVGLVHSHRALGAIC